MSFLRAIRVPFLVLFLLAAHAAEASADRIALYPTGGSAADALRTHVGEVATNVLRAAGHEVVSGSALRRPGAGGLPSARADLLAAAQANRAAWTLTIEVTPMVGQYQLHLRAANAGLERVEEIDVNVAEVEEEARIRDVLSCLVRASGLGNDVLRLTGDPGAAAAAQEAARREAEARAARESAERAAREETERAAREAERAAAERARLEAEARAREAEAARAARAEQEAAERARNAFANRPRYAGETENPWIVQAGFGFSGLVASPGSGGALGDFRARAGRAIAQVPGLEPRAGIDLTFGAASSVNLVVGAAYLATPWAHPVHLGGSAELGVFFATSGSRDPYFLMRVSGNVAWEVLPRFFLEAALPELTYLSAGALGIGMHVRAGYRF